MEYVENIDYHVDDLAEFSGALEDVRLNDVYEFDLAVETWCD